MTPTRQELTRWLWDAVGGGAKGIVFWLWNPRTLGREGGEWALLGLDGRPTERLLAVKDFARARGHAVLLLERAVPQKVASGHPLQPARRCCCATWKGRTWGTSRMPC
jgi:hypothetical protein